MTEISPSDNLGGQRYPFLHGVDWRIETQEINGEEGVEKFILDAEGITLRWVKDSKVVDLRTGETTEQFLKRTGLVLSMEKGGFVLSKRISRIMRPYFIYNFFNKKSVKIRYARLNKKYWDGAALISRGLLTSLNVYASKRSTKRKLLRELNTIKRVEFTVLSEHGQDKGHAYVVDDLDADIVLPHDTKTEVRLTNGQVFVGVNPVHHQDHMWLDIQSLINLHPFFGVDDMMGWLEAEGDLFLDSIKSGKLDEVLGRIGTSADAETWPIQEYLASGGKAMWFASVVRSLANQHTKQVTQRSLEAIRMPIPGGRYYVFVDIVGGKRITPGHIELDPESATAWVSRKDWEWLSSVWGGADQDDGLWIFPFTDHDGQRKILAWRSPNEIGQYAILKPTRKSHTIVWHTRENPVVFPPADSRVLTPRADQISIEYLGLVEKVSYPKIREYSVEAMDATIYQALNNLYTLGMVCNILMVVKAMWGKAPRTMPDMLENIIDAAQKAGDNLVPVRNWCYGAAQRIVAAAPEIPGVLHKRIVGLLPKDMRPTVRETTAHWLDDLMARVKTYIHAYNRKRDELANRAMPPLELIEYGAQWTDVGKTLRVIYAEHINKATEERVFISEDDLNAARAASEAYLAQWEPEMRGNVLAGTFAQIYLAARDENVSDAVCWQLGPVVDGERQPGIAAVTLQLLRDLGIIGELVETQQGIVRYYGDTNVKQIGLPVKLNGVWFHYARKLYEREGLEPPQRMADVPVMLRQNLKEKVAQWAEGGHFNKVYRVVWEGERKVVRNSEGATFAYVQRGQEDRVGDTIAIRFAVAHDGNLFTITEDIHETIPSAACP